MTFLQILSICILYGARQSILDLLLSRGITVPEKGLSLGEIQDAIDAASIGSVAGSISYINKTLGGRVIRSGGKGIYFLDLKASE